jgi:hypothetical protein
MLASWQVAPKVPKWEIDVDFSKGDFGSFIADPPKA